MTYAVPAQYEGESGNPGYDSNPNGLLSFSGVLKEEFSCDILEDLTPINCRNTGNDNTDDIVRADQPPMVLLHGTDDTMTPYANGKAIYDRAQ